MEIIINSVTRLELFLPTSGDRPFYGATVERRDGPSPELATRWRRRIRASLVQFDVVITCLSATSTTRPLKGKTVNQPRSLYLVCCKAQVPPPSDNNVWCPHLHIYTSHSLTHFLAVSISTAAIIIKKWKRATQRTNPHHHIRYESTWTFRFR